MDESAEIVEEILQEEKAADERLNDIAERVLNPEAADEDTEEEPEPIEDAPNPVRGWRAPARAKH